MIYKVFIKKQKNVAHVVETTRSLYLDIDANSELEGRIAAANLSKKIVQSTISSISNSCLTNC